MSDTPHKTSRDNTTGSSDSGLSQSGDLSGISEMFGLRDGQQAGSESGTRLVRRSDWQSVGLPSGDTGTRTGTDTVGRWVAATEGADQPPDISSRLVHGRYRLIAELGVGGMGVTYRAWDLQAGIPVVVKMPRREVRTDSEAMQRFAREIDAMLAVPHDSIVPITDHGDDDGCPFVVMRFLPGGSLADYRRRDEAGNAIRNPPGMLHFWLPCVAAALDHIHAKGMLHRDVKPGNIFLDGFLKPYLGDFGIAKVVDESGGLQKEQTLTATKMAVGTPEYMAPELFKPRSKPDGRVDQYALAVTVYEMLSGEKPFKGDRAHIIVEHSGLPVPPLAAKVPGLSQSLCMAVEKGLAKKSEDRFASCSEFVEAVLAELAVLPPESDTVRLLCPSCKNILKLPQKAAGKTGKCPRCQTAMDVAADLGSLWLESEERGGRLAATEGTATPSKPLEKPNEPEPPPAASKGTWRAVHWAAIGVAAVASLIAGNLWGSASQRERLGRQHAEEVRRLLETVDATKTSLRNTEGKIAELKQRVQDREKMIADLKKVEAERDSLAADNRRLSEAEANARNRRSDPANVSSKTESPRAPQPMVAAAGSSAAIDGVDIEFVAIPAGRFTMGSPPSEPRHEAREKQVEVTITEAFEIGKYEVTQRQWMNVMKTEPWKPYGGSSGARGPNIPACEVGWNGAMQFCKVLTDNGHASGTLAKDKVYRLPTEAEWEYACRAGTRTAFFCGEDPKSLEEYAWCDGNDAQARPVGGKKPNLWGLFDMYGNVSEWCLDWNDMKPLSGGVNPLGAASGGKRMLRGGDSRFYYPWMFRSAYRRDHGTSGPEGFRVVRGGARPITPPAPAADAASGASRPVPVVPPGIETLTNSIGIRFNLCRSGKFMMGDANGSAHEQPPHTVTITKPFYIGIYEVTNTEWKRVGSEVPSQWKEDYRPVESVSWQDATDFCQRLSALPEERKAGRVYRLPTEAEWEYGCRAGRNMQYWFGDDSPSDFAWFDHNSGGGLTQPVGQKKPSDWGLYDMHGNVLEWVNDWYDSGYYAKSPGSDPPGPSRGGSGRVARGGSWSERTWHCGSATRRSYDPSLRSNALGFRLALSPPESSTPKAAGK